MNDKKILVTGGLGYIGSHIATELLTEGYEVVIVDNLSNAPSSVLHNIGKLTGITPVFYEADVCDKKKMDQIFSVEKPVDAVIHLAAYKAVAESVLQPLKYYRNNIDSVITVLECMTESGVDNFVFSSSATVYGTPESLPVTETTPLQKTLSAYGSTKQAGEDICEKTSLATSINSILLRYFNPVGAHASGLLGETPSGFPNNLMPIIAQTVKGFRDSLTVYGSDYDTPDGTCIRDYIHVVDLAKAHVKACDRLLNKNHEGKYEIYNLGTGKGTSVLELITAFEKYNDLKIPCVIGKRRTGDTAVLYADVTKAKKILGWHADLTIKDMVTTAWNFEKRNG